MISYPLAFESIFFTLIKNSITPIIVGGYIRNSLLNIESKDIDIELYNLSSLDKLVILLKDFGNINLVGESFGVAKLHFSGYEIDFCLPRLESKIGVGHRGFNIKIESNIDFKTAAKRRDFTINAMGFDVVKKEFLDPFNGLDDLQNSILREVDSSSFVEDPLRVLRAIRFCSIYNFKMSKTLFMLCKNMIDYSLLDELAKERVFEELKKIILLSKKPSIAFKLLKKLKSDIFGLNFTYIDSITTITQHKTKLVMALAILCYNNDCKELLDRLTNDKSLITSVLNLVKFAKEIKIDLSKYELYKLATKIELHKLLLFSKAIKLLKTKEINKIYKIAKKLNILEKPLQPLVGGSELIGLGLSPSKEFSSIINSVYEAQMMGDVKTKQEALEWIKRII